MSTDPDMVIVSGVGLDYAQTRELDDELVRARKKFPGGDAAAHRRRERLPRVDQAAPRGGLAMATKRKAKVRLVACEWRVTLDGWWIGHVLDFGREPGDSAGDLAIRFIARRPERDPFTACESERSSQHPTLAAAVDALVRAAKESDRG